MSLEEIYEAIKSETKIVSYKITKESVNDITIFDSKFGGLPYWDFSEEFPIDNKGNKLCLLAQINFDKENIDDEKLPKKGILQFFISGTHDSYGMDFDDQTKQGNWKVVYHENVNYEISKQDIINNGVKTFKEYSKDNYPPLMEEYKITFTKTEDVISCYADNFNEIFVKTINNKYNTNLEEKDVDNYLNNLDLEYYKKFDTYGHKLLGYPAFTQYDPRYKNKYKKYDTLLLQIDSDNDIMWGDVGIANFFISQDDLEKNNYEDMLYNWDCC